MIYELKKLPLPLKGDPYGHFIWASDGQYPVADFEPIARLRGWGRLTGKCAWALSDNEAIEVQKAWQAEIVRRCNAHDAMLAALQAALKTAEFERHPIRGWHQMAREAIALATAVDDGADSGMGNGAL